MRAIVVDRIGFFEAREIEKPEPGNGEVLVKVSVTGLCRTDLKLIRTGHRDLVLPRVPGEEVVGEIWGMGDEAGECRLGQRVYIYPGVSCKTCEPCRSGAENLCRGMRIMGFHRHGGFAEYVLAPTTSLIPVPEGLPDDEAVFAEPLSCCLNALELARIKEGESIGIWGAGPAGTLLTRGAQAFGARAFNMEPDERRRTLVGGFAFPPKKGFDVCVVAVGSREAYMEALSRLNPRGRLVVFSGLPKEGAQLWIELNQLHYHEQTIVGAYGCSYRHGQEALNLLKDGRVKVKDMVSHKMSLWKLDEALEMVEQRRGMKILLYPD